MESNQISVSDLKASVYMGHKAIDKNGKNITWQKLRAIEDKEPYKKYSFEVSRDESQNKVYKITE